MVLGLEVWKGLEKILGMISVEKFLRRKWLVIESLGKRRRLLRSDPNVKCSCASPDIIGRSGVLKLNSLGCLRFATSLNRMPIFQKERIE